MVYSLFLKRVEKSNPVQLPAPLGFKPSLPPWRYPPYICDSSRIRTYTNIPVSWVVTRCFIQLNYRTNKKTHKLWGLWVSYNFYLKKLWIHKILPQFTWATWWTWRCSALHSHYVSTYNCFHILYIKNLFFVLFIFSSLNRNRTCDERKIPQKNLDQLHNVTTTLSD